MSTPLTVLVPHSAPDVDDGAGSLGLAEAQMREALTIVEDVYEGTLRMREKSTAYLPQWPKEEQKNYDNRLEQAVLYNAFKRTIKGLTGMVFRKPIELGEDVPSLIAGTETVSGFVENIDLAGRHLSIFMKDGFICKLRDGHYGIFVDWKGDSSNFRSSLEEKNAKVRPYWCLIQKGQFLRHETINVDGEEVLTMVAWIESDVVRDGEFRQKQILRVKQYELFFKGEELPLLPSLEPTEAETPAPGELQLVAFPVQDPAGDEAKVPSGPIATADTVYYRCWTRDLNSGTGASGWILEKAAFLGERMTRIPLAVDYAERTGVLTSRPPLLDLAHENIRHYQLRSERDSGLHTALVDILVILGIDPAKIATITVGSSIGIVLPGAPEENDAKFIGAEGNGLQAGKEELADIEQRMASYGLSMLLRQSRAAETAEAKRIDKSENDSELASQAWASTDAVEEALQYTAMWLGEASGGTAEVNTDFGVEPMDAPMVTALSALVASRQLTIDTLWDMMERAEMLPRTFDREKERKDLEAEEQKDLQRAADMMKATTPVEEKGAEEE